MNERRAVWRDDERLLLTSLEVDRYIPTQSGRADVKLLEVHGRVETNEPRVKHSERPHVRRAVYAELLVVGQAGVRVRQVIEVDADRRLRSPKTENLSDTHVELPNVVTVQGAWLEQIDGRIGCASRQRTAE